MDHYFGVYPDKAEFSSIYRIDNKNHRTKLKLLRDYDIIIAQKGEILIEGSMGKTGLKQGEAYMAVPGESVQIFLRTSNDGYSIWSIHYVCDEIPPLLPDNCQTVYSVDENRLVYTRKIELKYPDTVYRLLNIMLEEKMKDLPFSQELLTIYTRALLYELNRSINSLPGRNCRTLPGMHANRYVRRIIRYIHQNYVCNIKIQDISKLTGLNYNYANFLFKQYTGSTIMKYIDNLRMNHVKKLLLSTTMNLDDIAEQVGLRDGHYLSRKFKEWEGVSPGRFRENAR